MKKLLVMSALAVVSTAFVACSNENDLVQQKPDVPEEELMGTPFTVTAFSGENDTRAVRYGADGKEVNSGTGWISEIKIWGSQLETSNNWLDAVVFSRSDASSTTWAPARNKNGVAVNTINWPTENTDKATTFYGITDGNITNASNNPLNGVTENFANGKIVYNPATIEIDHYADGYENQDDGFAYGWVQAADPGSEISNFTVVDNTKINDLMVATLERVKTSDGSVPMAFEHALCGLYVTAKFCPVNQGWVNNTVERLSKFTILGIRLHGIATGGTYTFGSGWSDYTGTTGMYYHGLGIVENGGGVTVNAEATTATPHQETIVPSGTWLIVPQSVTGWNCSYNSSNLPADDSGAYLEILYTNANMLPEEYAAGIALYPLPTMTFEAGHNYRLVIDVEKVRTPMLDGAKDDGDDGSDGKCDFIFKPVKSGGAGG